MDIKPYFVQLENTAKYNGVLCVMCSIPLPCCFCNYMFYATTAKVIKNDEKSNREKRTNICTIFDYGVNFLESSSRNIFLPFTCLEQHSPLAKWKGEKLITWLREKNSWKAHTSPWRPEGNDSVWKWLKMSHFEIFDLPKFSNSTADFFALF